MSTTSVPLSFEELHSLSVLADGAARGIPGAHRDTLVRRGFVRLRAGVPALTIAGYALLVLDVTRASWLAAAA